jgi:hypothetical protein
MARLLSPFLGHFADAFLSDVDQCIRDSEACLTSSTMCYELILGKAFLGYVIATCRPAENVSKHYVGTAIFRKARDNLMAASNESTESAGSHPDFPEACSKRIQLKLLSSRTLFHSLLGEEARSKRRGSEFRKRVLEPCAMPRAASSTSMEKAGV